MGRLTTSFVLLFLIAALSSAQQSAGARKLANDISYALEKNSPVLESDGYYVIRPSEKIVLGDSSLGGPSPMAMALSRKVEVQVGWFRGRPLYVPTFIPGSGGVSDAAVQASIEGFSSIGISSRTSGVRPCQTALICEKGCQTQQAKCCSRWRCQEYSTLSQIARAMSDRNIERSDEETFLKTREPLRLDGAQSSGQSREVSFQVGTMDRKPVYVTVSVREDPGGEKVSQSFLAALEEFLPFIYDDDVIRKCDNGRECVKKCAVKGCCKYKCT